MQVSFDQNGYAYDTATGDQVTLEYDASGNAIDASTGEIIQSVLMPDNTTTYSTSNSTWSQIGQAVALQFGTQALTPTSYMPYGAYQPYGTANPYLGSQYGSSTFRPTIAGQVSSSGIGGSLNLSPTTLLIGAVVLFAFMSGRKGR